MAKTKRWVITTSGDRSLNEIRKSVADSGFKVDQVLSEIGLITGQAADDVAKKVRNISGVADVSPEEPINIGLPDAPVTW